MPSSDLDNGVYYFKARLGDDPKDFVIGDGVSPYYAYLGSNSEVGGKENHSSYSYESSVISDRNDETLEISIGSLRIPEGEYPQNSSFFELFRKISTVADSEPYKEIRISYYDKYGNLWTTEGNQLNSNFSITELEEGIVFNTAVVVLEADFDCTLYDEKGQSMTLRNGSCKLSFENI